MKLIIRLLVMALLSGLIIMSCEISMNNEKQSKITGHLTDNSDCKYNFKSSAQILDTPDSLSCVEYSFDEANNTLTLEHINAGFNCCPESLYCKIELKGDTILIQEFEQSALCDCNCLYDLDIEINGVDLAIYQIKFIEPYVADQSELIFEIDLNEASMGSYYVVRKQYPWGIISTYK